MTNILEVDVCVIGAGSGGLSVVAGAAQLGLKTVLLEKAEMGGDCLNTGCVPSKAFLAAAKRAQLHRKSDILGVKGHEPSLDFAAAKGYVQSIIAAIEPHDSQERFEGFGVHVIREAGEFVDAHTIKAGGHTIKARYIVVATGSRAVVPPIAGLDKAKVFTNETIFTTREKPDHLLIIGGGPIGLEMAQAHKRLGCKVSVVDMANILPRDDQKNVAVVREALVNEGIDLYENATIEKVEHTKAGLTLFYEKDGKKTILKASHVLVAAGRTPNVEGLQLEKAGVLYSKKGITVNPHLRTNKRHIFAIGDVSGGPQFTHVAGYHAGVVIRQVCFKMFWAKVDYKALPWVTYTDPELAQVGLTEHAARQQYGHAIKVVEAEFAENDRAVAEGQTKGQLRVVTHKNGKVLGASMVGAHAGELISIWALVITQGLKISALTGIIAPYPTLGEINKRAASAFYTPSLFSAKTRKIVGLMQKLPL